MAHPPLLLSAMSVVMVIDDGGWGYTVDGDYDGDGDDLKDGEDSTFVLQQLRPILHPLCLGRGSSQTTEQTIGRYLIKSAPGFFGTVLGKEPV